MNSKFIRPILLFAISLSINSGTNSFAENQDAQVDKELLKQVAQIELNVTGKAPDHENLEERLSSIEIKLFEKEQIGSTFDRLENIRKNIATAASQNKNGSRQNNDDWPALPGVIPDASQQSKNLSIPSLNASTASTTEQPIIDPASSKESLVTPPSNIDAEGSANAASESTGDEWPTALPHIQDKNKSTPKRGPLKVEVSESAEADITIVNSLKKAPLKEVDDRATKAYMDGQYALSSKLYDMLSERKPAEPRYFYGAGESYKMLGNYPTAFADLTMSWHLGNSDFYTKAINSLLPTMQRDYDDTFKVTYAHNADEPEAVLNAGVRMWKAGMTPQAVKLFEYSMKNNPAYRGVAAYDLGAVAEHNNDPKLALEYYKWAVQDNARLAAAARNNQQLAGAVNRSSSLIPPMYIQNAIADLQQKLLRGNAAQWTGWIQATVRPEHWSSEVCPLCAISRTSLIYRPGQATLD
jgi:tetratricopeptide (TPR) repeat protein